MKPRDDKKVDQIFGATLGLVKQKGLAGITMCEIAKEAGLATGTVYIYFKNKDELISQLFAECRRNWIENYFVNYDESKPFKEGFKHVWMNIFKFRTENFEEVVLMDQCYHSPFVNDCTKKLTKQFTLPLYKLVERGKEEGIFKNVDTFSLLTFMIGGIHEGVKHSYYNRTPLSKATIESMFEMSWDGLKA